MHHSKIRKILQIRKEIKSRRGSNGSDKSASSSLKSRNSFLIEIECNYDINANFRKEIEEKFERSSMNANYIFPRSLVKEQIILPKISHERRHISYEPSAPSVLDRAKTRNSINPKINDSQIFQKKFHIPSLTKKALSIEKRTQNHSNTPNPYSEEQRRAPILDSKRGTPTPGPNWRPSPLRLDKKKFLN